jgi:hypothetical protein
MTSGSIARRSTWRFAWLTAAAGAISLGSLVHGVTDGPFQPTTLLLSALAALGFLALSLRATLRALHGDLDAHSEGVHAHRWDALARDRSASRAA